MLCPSHRLFNGLIGDWALSLKPSGQVKHIKPTLDLFQINNPIRINIQKLCSACVEVDDGSNLFEKRHSQQDRNKRLRFQHSDFHRDHLFVVCH
jgi:hypothetical protein